MIRIFKSESKILEDTIVIDSVLESDADILFYEAMDSIRCVESDSYIFVLKLITGKKKDGKSICYDLSESTIYTFKIKDKDTLMLAIGHCLDKGLIDFRAGFDSFNIKVG